MSRGLHTWNSSKVRCISIFQAFTGVGNSASWSFSKASCGRVWTEIGQSQSWGYFGPNLTAHTSLEELQKPWNRHMRKTKINLDHCVSWCTFFEGRLEISSFTTTQSALLRVVSKSPKTICIPGSDPVSFTNPLSTFEIYRVVFYWSEVWTTFEKQFF